MKLGIVVVYFLKDSDLSLVRIHLSKIREYSRADYEIFAGDNGLSPAARELLNQTPCLRIYDPPVNIGPDSELNLSEQISAFTDYLVDEALASGATHVAIMHLDSFPVRDGWDLTLASRLDNQYAFASILRRENLDTVQSFSGCIFFKASFHKRCKPTMYPLDTTEYQEFLTTNNQTGDCGIGYSFAAYQAGLSWHPLLRSNQIEEHPIISGIYGDLIFHLGGASRANLTRLFYRRDIIQTQKTGNNNQLKTAEAASWVTRAKQFYRRIFKFGNTDQLKVLEAANRVALEEAKQRLITDPDAYLHHLRFGEKKQ